MKALNWIRFAKMDGKEALVVLHFYGVLALVDLVAVGCWLLEWTCINIFACRIGENWWEIVDI